MFPIFVLHHNRRARRARQRRFRKLVGRVQSLRKNRHAKETVTEYQPYEESRDSWESESGSDSELPPSYDELDAPVGLENEKNHGSH
ncbi:hypothetical protein CJU89_4914 [Yarrowia sp. B02]|nr:hypothetical protein CJU89_4914 [Yarrowia sp. B02]